jgi:hypothetical protein
MVKQTRNAVGASTFNPMSYCSLCWWVSMKIQSYGLSIHGITCLLCRVQSANSRANPSSIEITWYLGKNCRSVRTVHFISPWLWMKNQSYKLSVDPHVDPHAAAHECHAESAHAHANLSSIEITWYLGKNCTSVGTGHFIVLEYRWRKWNSGTILLQ